MAHFIAFVTEKRKRVVLMDVQASSVDIGTRTSCALTVQDNVAAERHCEIRFDEGRMAFVVNDLGSSTGTYVNGSRTIEPTRLHPGDGIVLGTLRLTVTLGFEQDSEALVLEVHEQNFQFQSAGLIRKTGNWIQGDREQWKESEVTFGRFPALRIAVWSALLLALLIPPLLLNTNLRDKALEPGPLSLAHAGLFDGRTPLLAHQALQAEKGCAACHEQLNGIPIQNCFTCHESKRFGHPYGATEKLASNDGNTCIACHVEHRGGDGVLHDSVTLAALWGARTVTVATRSGPFVPESNGELCATCHDSLTFDASRRETIAAAATSASLPGRTVKLAHDNFSHGAHIATGIDCKSCHVPASDNADTSPHGRDFSPMNFKGCMGCHGADGLDPTLRTPVALPSGDSKAPVFAVAWHGAAGDSSRCDTCHAQTYGNQLRTVTRQSYTYLDSAGKDLPSAPGDPKQLFRYVLRSHREQFERAIADLPAPAAHPDDDCRSCHMGATWLNTGNEREGRFYHGLHLFESDLITAPMASKLRSSTDGRRELARASSACDECHSQIIAANSLTTPYYRAEVDACAACHQTEEGDKQAVPKLIEAKDRLVPGSEVVQVSFPHDVHAVSSHPDLEGGCYACHDFLVAQETFRNRVVTAPSVKDCTQCHGGDHSNIAGGACGNCHASEDPVFDGPLSDESWSLLKQWPAPNNFSHFSTGHRDAVTARCQDCHAKVQGAASIQSVRIPLETDAVCRECHLQKRSRFHWR